MIGLEEETEKTMLHGIMMIETIKLRRWSNSLLIGSDKIILNIFLAEIHGSFDCNTNLTLLQFISSYKRLLFGMKGDIDADKFSLIAKDMN